MQSDGPGGIVFVLTEAWDLLTVGFLFLFFFSSSVSKCFYCNFYCNIFPAQSLITAAVRTLTQCLCSYSREEAALQHQRSDQRTRSSDSQIFRPVSKSWIFTLTLLPIQHNLHCFISHVVVYPTNFIQTFPSFTLSAWSSHACLFATVFLYNRIS